MLGDRRHGIITQAPLPAPSDYSPLLRMPILLDIDVFRDTDFSPEGPELWSEFKELREAKNRCFFESLQPETLRAYL